MLATASAACIEVPGGQGCREDLQGWRILDLHGTDEAIGRAYGTLLRDELKNDWVPMVEEMHFARMPRTFRALLNRHMKHFKHYFDDRASARARGLEAALELEAGTIQRYAWLTDLASIGPGLQLALGRTVQVDTLTGQVGDRCTSVVATDGEQTLLARNLDFWGMGYWQPHATLLFIEPLDASPGIRLMSAWATAALGDLQAASQELARVDRARASLHHRALAGWLEGELAARQGQPKAAVLAWQAARGLLSERADPDCPPMDLPLIAVLEDRIAGGWSKTKLMFPDLKFQDIIELRLGLRR